MDGIWMGGRLVGDGLVIGMRFWLWGFVVMFCWIWVALFDEMDGEMLAINGTLACGVVQFSR